MHRLGPERRSFGLDEAQAEICAETLAVLNDPELAELWGPDSQAEVPVVGLIPGSIATASSEAPTSLQAPITSFHAPTWASEVATTIVGAAVYQASTARSYSPRRCATRRFQTNRP